MASSRSIVFLLNALTDAHQRTRIDLLRSEGLSVRVLAFERDYYPGRAQDIPVTVLGRVEHGNYLRRMGKILRALPKIRTTLRKENAIYVFGHDLLALAVLARIGLRRRVTIVFEIADVRDVLVSQSIFSALLRFGEKVLLKAVDLVVVTSEAFISEYLRSFRGIEVRKHLVIENKVRPNTHCPVAGDALPPQDNDTITIGYFGLLRCQRSLEILLSAAEAGNGKIRVLLRGIFVGLGDKEADIISRVGRAKYVDYDGPYVNPDDLPLMYMCVDISWACYPYAGSEVGNWRWARTNRFYEACFFRTPLVAAIGTKDGDQVTELGIGLTLALEDVDHSVRSLLGVTRREVDAWTNRMRSLEDTIFTYSTEHKQLVSAIFGEEGNRTR